MTKRMLIDAAHPEEIRVAVVDGNRLEELDVESAARKQLKGNIYLAKVTRVEPSLQAAFVDYGGNRHGFLAFSEIHPDYYQIPVADREALIAEEEAATAAEEERVEAAEEAAETPDAPKSEGKQSVEVVGGEDIDEVEERRSFRPTRKYKIQEVIKRRQILLVQVVKEERGNKGAALTTYLSLAGRYCVLMPNTARGGGISRKIANSKDRKRLKSMISSLDIPQGIAVIVRTAGADRGKAEIKRDYEYLIRLWDNIRTKTLESTAPALIHEDANLVMRSIRDQYSREVDEILVEGDDGYRAAKDLMKMLIPSHAKKVQPYRDPAVPLFQRYHVESQLDAMHSPEVQLKSGGYIVINPTEALVSIDVNSGRATRGRNIEETALKTNLEAAEEVARQLRLRDLAGLVVIDFIDMDVSRNQTTVERRLKESMRSDRARIQIGRISPFGLLELSRQRLRSSLIETFSEPCPHCHGTGIRRSVESTAIRVLRGIEEEATKGKATELGVTAPSSVGFYILNHKRKALEEIEEKCGVTIFISEDSSLIPPDFNISRIKEDGEGRPVSEQAPAERPESAAAETSSEDDGKKKKRRRRGRRRKTDDRHEDQPEAAEADAAASEAVSEESEQPKAEAEASTEGAEEKKTSRRRRGRRGGRRRSRSTEAQADESKADESKAETAAESEAETPSDEAVAAEEAVESTGDEAVKPEPARRTRRRRTPKAKTAEAAGEEKAETEATEEGAEQTETAPEPAPAPEAQPEPEPEPVFAPVVEQVPVVTPQQEKPEKTPETVSSGEERPARRGWWNRPNK